MDRRRWSGSVPKIQVTTEDLDAAGSVLTGNVSSTLQEMVTALQGVHVVAPGFSTAETLRELAAAWGKGLAELAQACGHVASGLTAAAGNYQTSETTITEANNRAAVEMPGFNNR
jgi:hypothetical protein